MTANDLVTTPGIEYEVRKLEMLESLFMKVEYVSGEGGIPVI